MEWTWYKNPVTKGIKHNIGKEPKKDSITMALYVDVTEKEKLKEVEKIERALKIV